MKKDVVIGEDGLARKRSGLAIAALVLGLLGFVTYGVTAVVGLIMGIAGLNKINLSGGRFTGKGLAIGGICVSACSLIFWCLAVTMAGSHIKITSRVLCTSNLKQLGLALEQYRYDNGSFPEAATWCDAIKPATQNIEKLFICPSDTASTTRCSYVFNRNLSGRQVSGNNDIVVLYEVAGVGWNANGCLEMIEKGLPHKEGCNILFKDGHVAWISLPGLRQLQWIPLPEANSPAK